MCFGTVDIFLQLLDRFLPSSSHHLLVVGRNGPFRARNLEYFLLCQRAGGGEEEVMKGEHRGSELKRKATSQRNRDGVKRVNEGNEGPVSAHIWL